MSKVVKFDVNELIRDYIEAIRENAILHIRLQEAEKKIEPGPIMSELKYYPEEVDE